MYTIYYKINLLLFYQIKYTILDYKCNKESFK